MSWQRVWGVVLRYLYSTRDPSRITEFIFWPAIDIGFIGLLGFWVGSGGANQLHVVTMIVCGLILWQVTYRANYEVAVNVMDEFWEHNLTNLIATPLKLTEWVSAMMISGIVKTLFTLFFGSFVGWAFFNVNVFSLGWQIVPFGALCTLSGWAIGFFAAGIIIYKGPRLAQLPWVAITIGALFSTAYYPLKILPAWAQVIAKGLPMTYVFEGMRSLLTDGMIPHNFLLISLLLNGLYLLIGISFFRWMFGLSCKKGLARLGM